MEYPEGQLVYDDQSGVIVVLTDKYHVYTNYVDITGGVTWFHLTEYTSRDAAITYAKLVYKREGI